MKAEAHDMNLEKRVIGLERRLLVVEEYCFSVEVSLQALDRWIGAALKRRDKRSIFCCVRCSGAAAVLWRNPQGRLI